VHINVARLLYMVLCMTIRIDVISEGPEVVVYLAGRLSEDVTNELIDTCDHIKGDFVLDLSNLLFADDAGINVIRAISNQETKIRGASQFIQLLINKMYSQKPDGGESYKKST
jgi:anti-anti-sigma regulatory factor